MLLRFLRGLLFFGLWACFTGAGWCEILDRDAGTAVAGVLAPLPGASGRAFCAESGAPQVPHISVDMPRPPGTKAD